MGFVRTRLTALQRGDGIREEKPDEGGESFQVLGLDDDVETLGIAPEG